MLPVRVQRTALKPRCASAPATTSASAGKIGFWSSGTIKPDHARAPHAEVGRPLVPDHVEGREHRRSGRVRDPGLAVQDAAHSGLADSGLLGDVGKSSRHGAIIRQCVASVALDLHDTSSAWRPGTSCRRRYGRRPRRAGLGPAVTARADWSSDVREHPSSGRGTRVRSSAATSKGAYRIFRFHMNPRTCCSWVRSWCAGCF